LGGLFVQVDTAHAWHMKPSEFFAASAEDKALMVAHARARSMMAAKEAFEQEKALNKK
jgi:hypothetical protein